MEFPKLVYDDYYKFLMSFGVILLILGLGLGVLLANNMILSQQCIFIIGSASFIIVGIIIMVLAGKKWRRNQIYQDKKIEAEAVIAQESARQAQQSMNLPDNDLKTTAALVTYKVAAALPNTAHFDFVKEWRVWFLIENQEAKKYKAYVKIKYISDEYEEEISGSYYGGDRPWNLNAYSKIMAPGLDVPEKIKEVARQSKKIEIRIFCTIKDEHDQLVEEKLPIGYAYDYENKLWYYEP